MAVCAYKHYYAGSCIHTRPRFFRRFHKGFLHFAYIFKRNSGYFDEISVMGVPESQEISFDIQNVGNMCLKACVSHQACSCKKNLVINLSLSRPPPISRRKIVPGTPIWHVVHTPCILHTKCIHYILLPLHTRIQHTQKVAVWEYTYSIRVSPGLGLGIL